MFFPGVFYHLLHCDVVLNCPVDARQKCLLHRGVNEIVFHKEFGESLVDEEMERNRIPKRVSLVNGKQ